MNLLRNPLILGFVAIVWFVFVFFTSIYMSFPSSVAAQRVAYEVQERTDGQFALEMASLSPWWFGVHGTDVVVSPGGDGVGGEDVPQPFLVADNTAVRIGIWSLLQRTPRAYAAMNMGEAHLEAVVDASIETGEVEITEVEVDIETLPIQEIIASLSGVVGDDFGLDISGSLDIEAEADIAEGIRRADGKIKVSGSDILIGTVSVPSLGIIDLELGVPVDEVQIKLKSNDGTLQFSKGRIESQLADIEVGGELTLYEPLSRSRVKVKVVVDLLEWEGTALSAFRPIAESQMTSAKWADGKYHYTVTGTLERWDFRAEAETSSRSTGSRGAPTPTAGGYKPPPSGASDRTRSLRDRVRDRDASVDKPTRPEVINIGEPEDEEYFDDEDADDDILENMDGFDDEVLTEDELEELFEQEDELEDDY